MSGGHTSQALVPPEHADKVAVAGTPKGQTLASIREKFGGDEEATFEPFAYETSDEEAEMLARRQTEPMRLPLSLWSGADPE